MHRIGNNGFLGSLPSGIFVVNRRRIGLRVSESKIVGNYIHDFELSLLYGCRRLFAARQRERIACEIRKIIHRA
jgi:hypothetical protein